MEHINNYNKHTVISILSDINKKNEVNIVG